MALKRKAVVKTESALFNRSRAGFPKKAEKEEKDEAMEEVEGEEQEEEAMEEEEETETPEEKVAREEKEITAARSKELKGMYIDKLKELASAKGLSSVKKDDIIKDVLSCEAKERKRTREHEAKIRSAVENKKNELEGMTAPELKQLCADKKIGGVLSKQARVETLLKQWLEDDGVDKALKKMEQDAREAELRAMDTVKLRKVCDKAGVNPFVKEVLVDRIVRCEVAQGRFLPPVASTDEEQQDQASGSKGSMVDAILASETQRKKEKERKQQQEEALAKKVKELKGMSIEDLKKTLSKKGQEPVGKKEDLLQALLVIYEQEEATAAKKAKLQGMGLDQLKKLASSRGVPAEKSKEKLIQSLMAAEAKAREAVLAHQSKVTEVAAAKKEDLEAKTAGELKDLCVSKGLKAGVGKEDRVQRLVEEAKTSGEMDQLVAAKNKDARTQELLTAELGDLLKRADEVDADPFVTDVMIERILAHELAQKSATATEVEGPPAKKQRK